jgi:hypothetical protein
MSWADTGWSREGDGSGAWAAWENNSWEPSGGGRSASGSSWEQIRIPHPPKEQDLQWQRQQQRKPWTGDRRREPGVVPGNGDRPKANDPDGWHRGEIRPSATELEQMLNPHRGL